MTVDSQHHRTTRTYRRVELKVPEPLFGERSLLQGVELVLKDLAIDFVTHGDSSILRSMPASRFP